MWGSLRLATIKPIPGPGDNLPVQLRLNVERCGPTAKATP